MNNRMETPYVVGSMVQSYFSRLFSGGILTTLLVSEAQLTVDVSAKEKQGSIS